MLVSTQVLDGVRNRPAASPFDRILLQRPSSLQRPVGRHTAARQRSGVTALRQAFTFCALRMAEDSMAEAARVTEGSRKNRRGQTLYTVEYKADPPLAALVFAHGYGEHSGRYREMHDALAASGISVYTQDHFGHGKSEPKSEADRAYVPRFDDLVDDVDDLAREAQTRSGEGLPFFIAGQSMGGLIATHVVLRNQATWAGLILASAAIDAEWNLILRLQAPLGGLLSALAPRACIVPAVDPVNISEDPQVVAAYVADPLNRVGNLRARTANELLRGFRDVQRKEAQLALPLLALHAPADRITSYKAVQRLMAAASSGDKTLRDFPGPNHDLLHGPHQAAALDAVRDWILQRAHKPARL